MVGFPYTMNRLSGAIISFLKWSERYTRTDMLYLASSAFWGNLGTISVTLFSLALYLVFANVLSKETFGTYQYLLSLGALLGAFTITGMNAAVSRAVARGFDGSLREAIRFQLAWLWIPIAAALLGSAYYALQGNIPLALGLALVGIGTPLINTFNTYSAFLVGKQDFKRVFLYNFAINVPFYVVLITSAFLTENPILLIGINVGIQVLGYFVAYRATLRTYTPSTATELGTRTYGTHLSVMGVPSTIALHLDAVLAFHFLGPVGVALFAFATAIPERIGGLFKFLPSAALPRFAHRSPEEVRGTIVRRLFLLLPILLIAAALYALVAPFLFALLFPAYLDAIPYSQWYSLILITVLTQILVAALSAHQRVRQLYAFNIASPVFQVVLQLIGVVLYGLWGLVAGRLLGALLSFFLALLLVLNRPKGDVR